MTFSLGSTSLSYHFQFGLILGPLRAFRRYFGGRGQIQKHMGPTNTDYKLLFWKYSSILQL